MITKQQAIDLGSGVINEDIHFGKCTTSEGPRGKHKVTIVRYRSNGACKTWKTRPDEFRLPIKHGLYRHEYITHANADQFHLAEDCPFVKKEALVEVNAT